MNEKQSMTKAKRLALFGGGSFLVSIALMTIFLYVLISPRMAESTYAIAIFFPDHHDYSDRFAKPLKELLDRLHATKTDVKIKASNGETLDAWYFKLAGSKKIVLVSHGNAGNLVTRLILVKMLLESGVSVLVYDYEGYGHSSGKPSWAKIGLDGLSAYDYVVNDLHYKGDDIVVLGESLGSTVACYTAQNRKICGIVSLSGMTSLLDAGRERFGFLHIYPDWAFPDPHYDNVSVVANAHVPVLVVHGDSDPILPVRFAHELFAKAGQPKQLSIIHGAGHNDIYDDRFQPLISKALKEFLGKLPS